MSTPSEAPRRTDQVADERQEAARRYVEQLRAFYVHAGVFAASMLVIFGVNLFVNLSAGSAGDWSAWWSVWALIGWGAGIAVHGSRRSAESTVAWFLVMGAATDRQDARTMTA